LRHLRSTESAQSDLVAICPLPEGEWTDDGKASGLQRVSARGAPEMTPLMAELRRIDTNFAESS